jgi:hypothetical protein
MEKAQSRTQGSNASQRELGAFLAGAFRSAIVTNSLVAGGAIMYCAITGLAISQASKPRLVIGAKRAYRCW